MASASRNRDRALHRKPLWIALLVAALVIAGEQTVERYQRAALLEHERGHAIGELAQLRARLEGNDAALCLGYRSHTHQRMAAMRAVESGGPVIPGRVPQVQGGRGLIIRDPVFLPEGEADQPPLLWGLVSAMIDVDRLYELAGLPAAGKGADMEVAIRGKDGAGAQGDSFFGDGELFDPDPMTVTVSLPGGSWQIAAAPTAEWGQGQNAHRGEVFLTRIGAFGLAFILSGMAYQATRRNEAMRRTSAQLSESQAIFLGFMDPLPAGAFVRDARRGSTLFENGWLKRICREPPALAAARPSMTRWCAPQAPSCRTAEYRTAPENRYSAKPCASCCRPAARHPASVVSSWK